MPTSDIALQLVSIANSAGPITQDAGNFERLEELYVGFAGIINDAYGRPAAARLTRAPRGRRAEAMVPDAAVRRGRSS